MKKDINFPEVKDIAVSIVQEGSEKWAAYIINLKDIKIHNVLIASKGYGMIDGESKNTSVLRHFIEEVIPQSYQKIEPITEDVFVLSNEYHVSFYIDKTIYDKKFIFVAGAIDSSNLVDIPIINKKGILIK